MFRRIRWRIALPTITLILLAMAGLGLYLSHLVRQTYLSDLQGQLTAEARLLGDLVAPALARGEAGESLDALARSQAGLLGVRVTFVGTDGTVLGESHEDRSQMDNHLLRPEVQDALVRGQGSSIRYSRTAGYDMMYVAVVVKADGQVVGFARVAVPVRQVEGHVARLRRAVLLATLLAMGLAALLSLFIAGRTSGPVRELTHVASRIAEGDLGARLLPTTRDEVGLLARAFNRMAEQLQEKVGTLDRERGRLAAVLEHMADGVLIVDREGQVQLLNPAAAGLLGVAPENAVGRSFAQVVRHHQLIELWRRYRQQEQERAGVVEVEHQGHSLRAIITPFREAREPGYLVILQDLTTIRRLETVRQDFVSNVSHELRTPLAALKALVDSLRDGALEDPPAARRFLDRMDAEMDALTQVVQELLELSRIESSQVPLRLAPTPAAEAVRPAVERLLPQAERAGLRVSVEIPADLPPVLADAERVHQVVTNLVHNAIKFTPVGGKVDVSARLEGDQVVVAVRDTGVGISAQDLSRIFERFYKADRARSGAGTGLGLAIAKHIVQAHGGRIWAESTEGKGSTFFFSLPTAAETVTRP